MPDVSKYLYEHQIAAAEYIAATPKAYLGDEPGLGKTRSVLHGLHLAGVHNVLVICPAIVRGHWSAEAELLRLVGLGPRGAVDVVSYEYVVAQGQDGLNRYLTNFDAVVVDEAHYCKNPKAKRTRIVMGRNGYVGRFPRVVLASGTPMPRNPSELFPQLANLRPDVLDRHDLRKMAVWNDTFCLTRTSFIRGRMIQKVVGMKEVEQLRTVLDECILRRTLSDVGIDVPTIQWQTVRLTVPHWGGADASVLDKVTDAVEAGDLASLSNDGEVSRLRHDIGVFKAHAAADHIRDMLGPDDKVVVFAYHRDVLAVLREELRSYGVAYVDGAVPQPIREANIEKFQTSPNCQVFLGQITACQTGITLTAAHRVVIVEPDWQNTVNVQAAYRVARIGQTADRCIVQLLALADSIDEAVLGQCAREARMAAALDGE